MILLDHEEASPLVAKDESKDGGISSAEFAMFNSNRLEDDLQAMGMKIKEHEDNIKFLKAQRNKLIESILDLQVVPEKYDPSTTPRTEIYDNSKLQNEDISNKQILRHEKSAAGILTLLETHRGTKASQLTPTKDVHGIVAKLGKVNDENLCGLLSDYLGMRTMLAVVCKTYDGVKTLEMYDKEGNIDRNAGLHGLGSSIGKTIEGRFDVICLKNLRPYVGRFIADDPERRLDLLKPKLPTGECPPGFLGFAVNMIHIDPDNLLPSTSSGYGLRESLFYNLFSFLQVYKTRTNMVNALPCISDGAISLDGGIIRSTSVFCLGSRNEENVSFTKPSVVAAHTLENYSETDKQMKELRQKKERLEEDIKREQELLDHSKLNFGRRKEEIMAFGREESGYPEMTVKWTNRMNRVFLKLYIRELSLSNWRKKHPTKEGKKRLQEDFKGATGYDFEWSKFKNRYDYLKRMYEIYRRLLRFPGVATDSVTEAITMDDKWWTDRVREFPEASKLRLHPLPDMDLIPQVFREGHLGNVRSRKFHYDISCDDIIESVAEKTQPQEQNIGLESYYNGPLSIPEPMVESTPAQTPPSDPSPIARWPPKGSSFGKGRRKRTILEANFSEVCSGVKERVQPLGDVKETSRCATPTIDQAMEVLHRLPIVYRSPLYWASVKHFREGETSQRIFLALRDDEGRVDYLEMMTGVGRSAAGPAN